MLLDLHKTGLVELDELSLDAVTVLSSGGLQELEGLQLLGRFVSQLQATQAQLAPHQSAAWKSSLLMALVHSHVLHVCDPFWSFASLAQASVCVHLIIPVRLYAVPLVCLTAVVLAGRAAADSRG
jgi:hypothetical protein